MDIPTDKKKTNGITYGFPVGDMTKKIFFGAFCPFLNPSVYLLPTDSLTNYKLLKRVFPTDYFCPRAHW